MSLTIPPWRQSVTFYGVYAVIVALLVTGHPIEAVVGWVVLVVVSCGGLGTFDRTARPYRM